MLLASPASAVELPAEMTGYWMPMYDGRPTDPHDWPGAMHRISKPAYEWVISQNEWIEWDGICKIHDVKQLGEMDYEVGATCGEADGDKPDTMDPNGLISEDRYQFTLCGEILNIRKLEDNKPEPEGCKIS